MPNTKTKTAPKRTVNLLAVIDAEGIVTKETKYGDSSRILTMITRDKGKISVLAGNVRRGKSGLLSATSLFSHSRFTLFKSGSSSLYKLNEGELITPFSELRISLEKTAFASYFCEVTNYIVQDEAEDFEQFDLLLRSMYMLCKSEELEKIKAVFEFRALTSSGLLPDLSQCGECGAETNLTRLSPHDGCLYCQNCAERHQEALMINDGLLSAIAYISVADSKKIFSFKMSDAALSYLSQLGEACIGILLDKNFKTLDYLRNVMSLGD